MRRLIKERLESTRKDLCITLEMAEKLVPYGSVCLDQLKFVIRLIPLIVDNYDTDCKIMDRSMP